MLSPCKVFHCIWTNSCLSNFRAASPLIGQTNIMWVHVKKVQRSSCNSRDSFSNSLIPLISYRFHNECIKKWQLTGKGESLLSQWVNITQCDCQDFSDTRQSLLSSPLEAMQGEEEPSAEEGVSEEQGEVLKWKILLSVCFWVCVATVSVVTWPDNICSAIVLGACWQQNSDD